MDGLLILALIIWVISQVSKANKKSNRKERSGVIKENAAQRRAKRQAQMNAELEKRREQLAMEKRQTAEKMVINEGEPAYDQPANVEFRGSMQAESTEGECICEPELEHKREPEPAPDSVYAGEIGREPIVDFSTRGVLQGIVMSEILTRPHQRARHR